jgi:hypothetical protein
MNVRIYLVISGTIFFAVGLLHLLRLLYYWPVQIGTWFLPQWLSYFGVPAAWTLAVWAYRLRRR